MSIFRAIRFQSITLVLVSTVVVISIGSCKRKGCTDALATNFDGFAKVDDGTCDYKSTDTISGFITEDKRLNKETNWIISGWCHVKDSVTLTIEPGTNIFADPNEVVDYLLIEPGGKIEAAGTSENPILFTSGKENPAAGDWGGLIICGKAPINAGTAATVETNDVVYGGTKATDNSGTLTYIVVAYGGNVVNAASQYNGISFYGVGAGTTVNHIQATQSANDGISFYGGTVNVDYAYSNNNLNLQLKWDFGYAGNINYLYCESSTVTSYGSIKGQNNIQYPAITPTSNPTLSNVTLRGNGAKAPNDGLVDALQLTYGTKADITNLFIENYSGSAIVVQHDETVAHVQNGDIKITNIKAGQVAQEQELTYTDGFPVSPAAPFVFGTTAEGAGSSWLSGWTFER